MKLFKCIKKHFFCLVCYFFYQESRTEISMTKKTVLHYSVAITCTVTINHVQCNPSPTTLKQCILTPVTEELLKVAFTCTGAAGLP